MIIKDNSPLLFKKLAIVCWSFLIVTIMFFNFYMDYNEMIRLALNGARLWLGKDVIYRAWNARHGGVYVAVGRGIRPNPYLKVPERDIITPSGRMLTLVNPAYMSRQVYQLENKAYHIQAHITSLSPLNPKNKPDQWEINALRTFRKGHKREVWEVLDHGKKAYLRYMIPLRVRPVCLRCHDPKKYKVGEIRGGLSVKIPLSLYFGIFHKRVRIEFICYFFIWIIGCGLIMVVYKAMKKDIRKIKEQQKEIDNIYRSLEHANTGIMIVDSEYKIVYTNEVVKRWMGNIIGKTCYNVLENYDKPCVECSYPDILKKGEGSSCTMNINGRIIEIWSTPLEREDGRVFMFKIMRDVTERKKAEEERYRLEKLESLGILAGGIAHDFNNILTSLFGNIELAMKKISPSSSMYANLQMAYVALDQAHSLTRQLLTFAKGGEPVLGVVDLTSLVKTTVSFVLRGSSVKSHFYIQEGLWDVLADKGQISQVISNLVINAVHSMPQGGNIYIRLENVEAIHSKLGVDSVRIAIRDEGCGIPPQDWGRVFDPYFTTKAGGTGLGLAIVHSIVLKHHGIISLDSEVGKGTEFGILLPAARGERGQMEKDEVLEEMPDRISARVLVVDDDDMVRSMVAQMLEMLGMEVEVAGDGAKGIQMYKRAMEEGRRFDMVIMDLTIPGGVGGREAIKRLLVIDPHAKVIVTSGYSTEPVMANYREYGFVGRLFKPFKLEELKREIVRVINTSEKKSNGGVS